MLNSPRQRQPQAVEEKLAVTCLSLMMLMASLGSSVVNAALPTLAKALDASFQSAQWILLAYLLAVTTLVVSVGRLSDAIGHRRLLIVGIGIFTLSSVLCALAGSLAALIVARTVQGIGAAVMMATPLAMVSQVVSEKRLGSAMGALGAMSAVGTALGPSLGGVMTAWIGWRSIFLMSVPIGVSGLLMAMRYLPYVSQAADLEGKKLDVGGTLLLVVALGAYALSVTIGRGEFGLMSIALALAAAVALATFVLVQARSASPLIPLNLFRDPSLTGGLAMSLLVSAVLMSTLVVGPFYLTGSLKLDSATVGLLLTVGPAVVALSGQPAGRLADRFGAQTLSSLGLIAIASGCLMLASFPTSFGVGGYVLPIALIAAGYAAFQTSNNTIVMVSGRPEQRGLLSGMLNLSRNLGLITGASVMGYVFAAGTGTSAVTSATAEQVAQGFRATFAVGTVLAAFALAIATASRRSARAPVAVLSTD